MREYLGLGELMIDVVDDDVARGSVCALHNSRLSLDRRPIFHGEVKTVPTHLSGILKQCIYTYDMTPGLAHEICARTL